MIISIRQNYPELQENVHTPISAQMENFATNFISLMEGVRRNAKPLTHHGDGGGGDGGAGAQ